MPSKNGTGRVRLDALEEVPVPIEVVSPSGKKTTLHMRPLTHREVREIEKVVPTPRPPIGDMRRNPQTGAIERTYNDQDPAYLEALAEANQRQLIGTLLRSLPDLDVIGETELERIEEADLRMQAWLKTQLVDQFNRINGWGRQEMAEAETALTPFGGESSASSPASVGVMETGTTSP